MVSGICWSQGLDLVSGLQFPEGAGEGVDVSPGELQTFDVCLFFLRPGEGCGDEGCAYCVQGDGDERGDKRGRKGLGCFGHPSHDGCGGGGEIEHVEPDQSDVVPVAEMDHLVGQYGLEFPPVQ